MDVLCKRKTCKNYQFLGFIGWGCELRQITINETGKCDCYVRDSSENIKLVNQNKFKK